MCQSKEKRFKNIAFMRNKQTYPVFNILNT
jgi:hypothetical protein